MLESKLALPSHSHVSRLIGTPTHLPCQKPWAVKPVRCPRGATFSQASSTGKLEQADCMWRSYRVFSSTHRTEVTRTRPGKRAADRGANIHLLYAIDCHRLIRSTPHVWETCASGRVPVQPSRPATPRKPRLISGPASCSVGYTTLLQVVCRTTPLPAYLFVANQLAFAF